MFLFNSSNRYLLKIGIKVMYIDKQYLETFFSADQIDALASYGNINAPVSASIQDAKIDQYITGSCNMIDSWLQVAGYTVPLPFNPPAIQEAVCYLVIQKLFAQANQPIPENFKQQITEKWAYLNLLKDKQVQIPGILQDPNTGTGANMFSLDSQGGSNVAGTVGNNPPNRFYSVKALYGSFF